MHDYDYDKEAREFEEDFVTRFLEIVNSESKRQKISFNKLAVRRDVAPMVLYRIAQRRRGISLWTMAKMLSGLGIRVEFVPTRVIESKQDRPKENEPDTMRE